MLKKLGGEGEAEGASKGTVWKPVAQKVEAALEEQGADPGLRGGEKYSSLTATNSFASVQDLARCHFYKQPTSTFQKTLTEAFLTKPLPGIVVRTDLLK